MKQASCAVPGCTRKVLARGWCSAHWQRWKRNGEPGSAEIATAIRRCVAPGCDEPNYGRGYCRPHWRRWKKYGDPLTTPVRPSAQGCAVEGCEDPHSARGYCASHYARWKRTGDPGAAFTVRRRTLRARDAQGRKQCRDCDEWFPEAAFHRNASASDGLVAECKDCHWAAFTTRRYGIPPTWYEETLARQSGVCAICGEAPQGRRMHIDHDHRHCSTDKACTQCVRGLLCGSCNTGIGMFRERADLLHAAMSYLERYGR